MKKTFIILFVVFSLTYINGQVSRKGLDLKIGYNPPVFNFDDVYDSGLGLSIGILYPFYDNLQFSLNTGFVRWGFDNNAFNLKYTNDKYTEFNIEAPINFIPLTFGIKYYASNTKVRPYFSAELGFFFFSQKTTGTYYYASPNGGEEQYKIPELKESGFRPMLNLGAGFTTPINEEWMFDFQVKMNALLNAQSVSGSNNGGGVTKSSSTNYFITIAGGINYYFGAE